MPACLIRPIASVVSRQRLLKLWESAMSDRKQWFCEGLNRLIESVKTIDYHRLNSLYASKGAGLDVAHLKSIPERVTWSRFRQEVCDELNAVVKIAREEHKADLASCRKLSISLTEGFYQDGSPLIFETIVELVSLYDQLAVADKSDLTSLKLEDEAARLLQAMLTFEVGKRVTAQELFNRDELAFRGDTAPASISTRLKRLKPHLPKNVFDFTVHETGSCGFTWKKKPKS